MSVSVEFLAQLYNKSSCYADRLTAEQLAFIHIPTGLEDAVRKWLLAKKDVVLLGNPGDGKTHLIRFVDDVVKKVKAEVVLDATAEREYGRLLDKWKSASNSKRPFCIAINQGPLNRLLAQSSGGLSQLEEVRQQLRSLLYYDAQPEEPRRVVVVDLNLRSVLTKTIVECALQHILKPAVLDACDCFADETSDVALNRKALNSPQVQERIIQVLIAAGYAGRHISMRDLLGFLSFILLGGRSVSEMRREPSNRKYRYFNLFFEGEGELFNAVRDVFEPERATLPEVDEHLWENTGVRNGWLFDRPPLTPDHYEDAWEQFTTIKRQYYFEHEDGGKLLELRRDDNSKFSEALQNETADHLLSRVLKAVNQFFCPGQHEDGQRLRLWGAQQYDSHSPRVLVSCYVVSKDKFDLFVPRLAPWLTNAIDYRADHLLLRYKGNSTQPISLRIDRGFWRALVLAEQGLPMGLRSPQYSKSLQSFITKLYRVEANPTPVEQVRIYNIPFDRLTGVTVDRRKGVYAEL